MGAHAMRSEGGNRKDGGGSPGIEPTPVEFKDMGRDGAMVALHNQSETIEEESKWFCLS